METIEAPLELSGQEIVELAAIDPLFYSHHFFPKAFRQEGAIFHEDMWNMLEDPLHRYTAIKVTRDGAKTTILRAFASKRVAYGISRTILFVGKSEEAAMKSVDWMRRAVLFNPGWSQVFNLSKGEQWSGSQIDVKHETLGINIRILAIGITGSTRGINIDDYRPDLIIVDDPCDEENTATVEQRTKISNLFFGSLYNSLAPTSDMPEAKMVLLQTPLDGEDLIEQAMRDAAWETAEFSILLPTGESAWPARYPTEELHKEKQQFIDRGQLAIWMREKEVTIISDATTFWKRSWVQYWDVLPEGGVNYLACDPTPPPKEGAQVSSSKNQKLDDFVFIAFKVFKGDIYILESWAAKSPLPTEVENQFFSMVLRWRPRRVGLETVLFARTVKYSWEKEMRKRGQFVPIFPVEDKRKKQDRITQELTGRLSAMSIFVDANSPMLVEQIERYPLVNHDDFVDCLAIGMMTIQGWAEDIEGEYDILNEDQFEELEWGGAP